MEKRRSADKTLHGLVLHDLRHCAEIAEGILRDAGSTLPPRVRNELVLCSAACGIAAESLQEGRPDLQALELCHQVCLRCIEACRPLGQRENVPLCTAMAQLCGESLQQLLYDHG